MPQQSEDLSRRSFLKVGVAAAGALGALDLLGATAEAAITPVANPEATRSGPTEQGMVIVDSHCHATPIWYGDIDALRFEMDRNNVKHAMLVQIGGYFNNEYQFDAVTKFPGRFANVVLTDYTKPDAIQTLEQLAQRGVSGVRIAATTRSPGDDPFAIWKAAAKLGLSVTTGGRSEHFASDEFAQIVEMIPEVPVVIEHLGTVNNPTDDPGAADVRPKLLTLARFPNAHIKLHGLGEFARRTPILTDPFPFQQPIPPLLDMVYDAFGPQRMMWGSDFPLVNSREGYPLALKLAMDQFASKSEEDRAWIFGRTALKVFPIKT